MTSIAAATATGGPRSVFAGADVCREAGLLLPAQTHRVMFEQDVWDFTEVIGLPVQMALANRRFEFTAILDSRWRQVAKELILAMLAPRHEAVAFLPRAYRTPVHVNTASGRLSELTRWLNWLTQRHIASLGEVDDDCCRAYLSHRRHARDEHGTAISEHSPATRRAAAQVIIDMLNHGELFSVDRLDTTLRPWSGATASAVAGMRSGRQENKTPPVSDAVLQPLLAAALYAVDTLGPHAVTLASQLRATGTVRSRLPQQPGSRAPGKDPATHLPPMLERHRETTSRYPN